MTRANPVAGLAAWTTLLVIATAASVATESAAQGLVAAIALVAVIQVVSATLPGGHIAIAWRLGLIAVIVAAPTWSIARIERFQDVPKARPVTGLTVAVWQLVLVGSSFVLAAAIWATSRHPHLHFTTSTSAAMTLAVVLAAFVEEGCFRRVVYVGARPVFGRMAPVASAIVWASAGIGDHSYPGVVILLGAGVLYAYAYERTGRWWPIAAAHAIVNIAVLLVLPGVR